MPITVTYKGRRIVQYSPFKGCVQYVIEYDGKYVSEEHGEFVGEPMCFGMIESVMDYIDEITK